MFKNFIYYKNEYVCVMKFFVYARKMCSLAKIAVRRNGTELHLLY